MTTDRERADMAYQLLKDALSDDEASSLLDRLMVAERERDEARAALEAVMDHIDNEVREHGIPFNFGLRSVFGQARALLDERGGQPT